MEVSLKKTGFLERLIIFLICIMIPYLFFSDESGLKHKKAWKILLNEFDEFDEMRIATEIIRIETRENVESNIHFLNEHGIELEYIIFHDEVNWKIEDGVIYKLKFKVVDNNIRYSIRKFSKDGFKKYLFELQGESMIMNKRLIYSNTELEGYLADLCYKSNPESETAIFPGDLDLIIYDQLKSLYVLEFKKHTIHGPINEQSFMKYIYNDRKKYQGIASAAKEFGHDHFYNIIYSTNVDDNKIKIEKIDTDLEIIGQTTFEFTSKEDLQNKFKLIFKLNK